ncbi:tRNA (guanosine(18)-2'-O)-methyltransferase TrmH [Thermus scotoductus]|uniref:tRNA (guanosine(18)-2'-O)-methyltransferase n=1 Tax=Thermus scotoductus TaxID=37636 RepID=A0A430R081_THESC|nr:tRNA (guanosine(18)-2'-O)-methyltransferase TrmH [Thermus scotoductus]RTG92377.1 tRNA (guanosine(18)-2'-O)-methyltransferase TrmH [Thermus scotoductus]RTH00775.1 tRNA (guanosine(18)-2'-O)-methyltransferase TrmH [Thermus scotoductus]RTH16914.1 tRNA (guanosine(18)-2'-O)-methyltransferase TrmH [Thermus scotoductus]RTH97026.1 tRNA (guanosine(18)-2'-O)-methyltransferase TrmH [Thermus scotoductus]RTI17897.1 tRNA (guanosine(18)-2'-O)-methyltransferase TrmH [Thermus scotoductus]
MTEARRRRIEEVLRRRQPDLTVLLENVHKPHNLSAILRSCDAVGVLEAHAVNPTGGVPTFNETSGGSHKWVYLQVHPDIQTAIGHLRERGFRIYATALREDAQDFREVDYTQPTAILLGAEKWGVSREALALSHGAIKIPMLGMVQSLNVSVAAAVILFEAQRQRLKAGLYEHPRLDPELYQRVLEDWLRK